MKPTSEAPRIKYKTLSKNAENDTPTNASRPMNTNNGFRQFLSIWIFENFDFLFFLQ
jgi:hypothetical protein